MKALLFDVFGTCVDWRGSVERELSRRGLAVELAVRWRGQYQPQLETVRSGARPWTTLDVLHREALDSLVQVDDPAELTCVWHALDPWPDTVEGLEIAHAYKPQPEAYLASVSALGLEPDEAVMVAAHNDDLAAAAACGLRTAFVPRPTEDTEATADWDIVATDFLDLASQCGA
jgi:2-haloacid dehalogenase